MPCFDFVDPFFASSASFKSCDAFNSFVSLPMARWAGESFISHGSFDCCLSWCFRTMMQRKRLRSVSAASPSSTFVTCFWKLSNRNGVKKPSEPKWNAITGGTDSWNSNDAYKSVPSPPRHTIKSMRLVRLSRPSLYERSNWKKRKMYYLRSVKMYVRVCVCNWGKVHTWMWPICLWLLGIVDHAIMLRRPIWLPRPRQPYFSPGSTIRRAARMAVKPNYRALFWSRAQPMVVYTMSNVD